MTASSVDVTRVDPAARRDDILSVLTRNLPAASCPDRFDWLYLSNPAGPAQVWVAYAKNGNPVATSAAIPRLIRVGDTLVKGAVLGDFAVDPAHRSLGPALQLLKATLAPVTTGEYALTYDYPSESMYVIYRRMASRALGDEHRYVRLLSAVPALSHRYGKGIVSTYVGKGVDILIWLRDLSSRVTGNIEIEPFPDEFHTEFWKLSTRICGSRTASVDRNAAYLNWRFRQHPERNHTTLVARRDGALVGYVILHPTEEQSLVIDELICLPVDDIVRALMSGVLSFARSVDAVKIQCTVLENSPVENVLKKSGFSCRGSSIGPVVFTSATSGLNEQVSDSNCWWLGDGDRDG